MRNYWQPEVTRNVERHIDGCDMCQRIKNQIEILVGKLKLSKISEKSQIYLIVDFITKLLVVAGKYMILVVYNRLSKITYFVAITEDTLVKGLVRLFRNNVWKLHRLPKSVMFDRGLQFAVELMRELNKMLEIEMKLLTVFYPQTDSQMERMNSELKQYLRFFVDHRQKDWPEQLAMAEFTVNNKTYLATKISLFMVNYSREQRIGIGIRRREKIEKVMKFVERIKKVQEKAGAVLRKTQEEMKWQADRERKEVEEWKKEDKMMLSIKDLVFKKYLMRKLVDHYVGLYIIDEVVPINMVKLQLSMSMRIYPVVNIS